MKPRRTKFPLSDRVSVAGPFGDWQVAAAVLLLCFAAATLTQPAFAGVPPAGKTTPLFDGKTLAGWEGDLKLWRVEDDCITGGSLVETVKHNDFLASRRDFTNFIVRMKIKLTGAEGFINSGFQIRSQRVPQSSEMSGYQCDYGDPNWWGAIYDESRRNKVMSPSDMKALGPVIQRNDWNAYVIRADGPRITTWINGVQGTHYTEADASIPDWGKLGIQVHGGGKALIQVKDITVEELPPAPPGKKFIGAPEPKAGAKASPLSPEEERATFTLPPGFELELVASEAEGIGKFVTVDWDLQGRMWSMTALEYPVDANENPAAANELYASKAQDKVLVWDKPFAPGPHQPRVFAEGLAIPLGVLPYKNGAYVQHGPDIVFLSDADGDGKADKRDVILTGFGVQDSHLFPHQFTRAPGNWIWMAQGAFNYSKVKTTRGSEVKFDQTRMARFRYDGSDFDITSQGPCNIWGLAMTAEGETWIQEANDYGYPTMPFHAYANYPGCSDSQFKSYAPEFPGTAPDFKMGGTGLSGLALSDKTGWPEAYADVMYVANPITRKIQAIKIHRDGPRYRLQKLPDFVLSSDEWFRPVALRLGPDGCLYFVDWYNKIISHNEVPRNHPERDKKRGRIWRVRHQQHQPLPVPDFTKLSGDELLEKLGGESTPQSHLAWQAITDRQLTDLAPKLKALITDKSRSAAKRIASLWALEGLDDKERFGKGVEYFPMLKRLLADPNRNVRREAVRVLASVAGASKLWSEYFDALDKASADSDPEVRAEVIKTTAQLLGFLYLSSDSDTARLLDQRALPLIIGMAKPSLVEPTGKSTHNGKTIKVQEAYDREFERYLVRLFLERHPEAVAAFLDSEPARLLPIENRLLATLALEPKASAARVAQLLPQLTRPPGQEEVLRLAQFLDEPGVGDALRITLKNAASRSATLEELLKVRNRLDTTKLIPLLVDSAQALWSGDASARMLALRLVSAFKISEMEVPINEALMASDPELTEQQIAPALRALRELGANKLEGIVTRVRSPNREIADEAVLALASSRNEQAPLFLFHKLWGDLSAWQRRSSLDLLAGTKTGGKAIVNAVQSGSIEKADLDSATLDKLNAVLPNDTDLAALLQEMAALFRPALRLAGKDDDWVDSDITLDGPFTVETWVKLDHGIDNNDGILGAPGVLDMNFYDAKFRVWVGGGAHDVVVARKNIVADTWTHVAVTRDALGKFRIYLNGELDSDESKLAPQKFEHCRIGWTGPGKGTAGWLTEYRVWNGARAANEIRANFDWSYDEIRSSRSNEAQTSRTANVTGHTKDQSLVTSATTERPPGLDHLFTGTNWGKLHGSTKVEKTSDFPPLLTSAEARAQMEKFAKFRALAEKSGDVAHGKELFTTICMTCHSVGGQSRQIGPVLSGAGAMGTETLLRALLTPNAAMEAGYRAFRIELKDGDVIDGLLVSQDKDGIVLRRPNSEDQRIPQSNVRRAGYTKLSVMPEGLVEALKPEEVSSLFAYLRTLK